MACAAVPTSNVADSTRSKVGVQPRVPMPRMQRALSQRIFAIEELRLGFAHGSAW
jgi:hypothetical protein